MDIWRCQITLQEPLYFATREIGRLYETGRYLHNYALTYAFGLVAAPYFSPTQVPRYTGDLVPLREQAVYVTPASPLEISFVLATLKYGSERLHEEMLQGTRNTPSFGRLKELAPESSFECYVLSEQPISLPRWIRLGKWMSKALVEVEELKVRERAGSFSAACTLNPLDVPDGMLRTFDIISMPPSSLVAHARLEGRYYEVGGAGRGIPVGLQFNVPEFQQTTTPRRRRT